MYKIAMIGCKNYVKESKIAQFIKRVYSQFGTTATILSGGNDVGAEKWIKKYSIEFGLRYREFNPSFTGYRMYSALSENYYGKGFHPSHFYDRYKKMLHEADRVIAFVSNPDRIDKEIEFAIKQANKMKIESVIVD